MVVLKDVFVEVEGEWKGELTKRRDGVTGKIRERKERYIMLDDGG